ncbi:TraG family conjugative transposon ATPase [Robertkochia sediminum]|uniref:TraG family conjugative transposon ATPase n=1 Tax=Robertkochia sediminum TaxID=2785326 RepID=UPI001932BE6D|nr:TraG family conjugative transposon ATPase [Robertkochia sediminum]MBL7473307.1 TraG family conjugative transposon ATPase [Robertkochia sediminum]
MVLKCATHFKTLIPPGIEVDNNVILTGDGYWGFGYELQLPEIYSLGEKQFDVLHGVWHQAFKNLPDQTIVLKQDHFRKRIYQESPKLKKSFLQDATDRHFSGRRFLEHQSILMLFFPIQGKGSPTGVTTPFKNSIASQKRDTLATLESYKRRAREVVHFLQSQSLIGIFPLKEGRIKEMAKAYWNAFQNDFTTDIVFNADGIQAGVHRVGLVSLNHEKALGASIANVRVHPRYSNDRFQFFEGFLDSFGLDIPYDHIVSQRIVLESTQWWRALLHKRRLELKKSIHFGSENRINLERIERYLEDLEVNDAIRMVKGQVNILYYGQDGQELQEIEQRINTKMRERDLYPHYPKGRELHRYFKANYFGLPGAFRGEDHYVSDLQQALCLWIQTGRYKSDAEGVWFTDRHEDIPVLKDVWDRMNKRIKARNFAVLAPTGEGKSFLANHILRQFYEQEVRLIIIDLGGSYQKFGALYPDDHQIIRYEYGQGLGINPFYLAPGDTVTSDKIEDLVHFIHELYAPGEDLKREEKVALKNSLVDYYREEVPNYHLEGYLSFLKQQSQSTITKGVTADHFDFDKLLFVLSEYVGDGLYGFLFKANDHIDDDLSQKSIVIFELDEIREHQELLSVMLTLIRTTIHRYIWADRSKRGLILFDEFAKQLQFPNVLQQVAYYYQAIRKQNAAVGIILQSISQLPENHLSNSIIDNTQVIYALRNEKGYAPFKGRFHLSTHDVEQLQSLTNQFLGDRRYTEVFIKVGNHSNVYRLEVAPEAYAAYLTDGPEYHELMKNYREIGSMEEAIAKFVHQKNLRS